MTAFNDNLKSLSDEEKEFFLERKNWNHNYACWFKGKLAYFNSYKDAKNSSDDSIIYYKDNNAFFESLK